MNRRSWMRILRTSTAAALIAVVTAGAAAAGPRDHEDGFFLRLSAGGGSASSTLDDGVDEIEISGSVGDLNLAIGGMVTRNLALHGTLMGWSASDPDLQINGTSIGEINGDVTAAALGGGLTWYIMPVNLYLSGSLGVGSLELDAGNVSIETDNGLFADLTLGKEWWVGQKWALGAALGLTTHSFSEPEVNEDWGGTSFCLRFSATMN